MRPVVAGLRNSLLECFRNLVVRISSVLEKTEQLLVLLLGELREFASGEKSLVEHQFHSAPDVLQSEVVNLGQVSEFLKIILLVVISHGIFISVFYNEFD